MSGIYTGGITSDVDQTDRDQLDSKEIDELTKMLADEKQAGTDWARECAAMEAECDRLLQLLDDFHGADKNPARQSGKHRRHLALILSRAGQPADPPSNPSLSERKAHGGKRVDTKAARLSKKRAKFPVFRWPKWLSRGNLPWGDPLRANQDS